MPNDRWYLVTAAGELLCVGLVSNADRKILDMPSTAINSTTYGQKIMPCLYGEAGMQWFGVFSFGWREDGRRRSASLQPSSYGLLQRNSTIFFGWAVLNLSAACCFLLPANCKELQAANARSCSCGHAEWRIFMGEGQTDRRRRGETSRSVPRVGQLETDRRHRMAVPRVTTESNQLLLHEMSEDRWGEIENYCRYPG